MSDYKSDLNNMMCLDVFISSLNEEDYKSIRSKIKPGKRFSHPLISYGVSSIKTSFTLKDLDVLQKLKDKHQWDIDLKKVLRKSDYEVLVLTDTNRTIEWVSDGFFNMTGYHPEFAIGQTPAFLQGDETTAEMREMIGEKLEKLEPFTETIVNYRKNKESYLCQITIYPLFNSNKKPTHFLALEKEVHHL